LQTLRLILTRLRICRHSNSIKARLQNEPRMQRQKGFISTLILIIVGLALLKYFFNWSVFDAAASPQGRATIDYIRQVLDTTWAYISAPVTWIWSSIVWPILELFWKTFLAFLEWGRETAANPPRNLEADY
jgi:hypothetical protein